MEKKLVTIVIPVYNAESTLEKCIKSVMEQSYEELDIILLMMVQQTYDL